MDTLARVYVDFGTNKNILYVVCYNNWMFWFLDRDTGSLE